MRWTTSSGSGAGAIGGAAERLEVDYEALGYVAQTLRDVSVVLLGCRVHDPVAEAGSGLVGTETAVACARLAEHLAAGVIAYAGRLRQAGTSVDACAAGYLGADDALAAGSGAR